jgi:acyl-CoA synthetase (AMP-forming)/AMP-acid ligase II
MFSIVNGTNPDRPAMVYQDTVITYRQLLDKVGSLANGLVARGYRPGDKMMIMLDNCPEIMYVYYACYYTGLVAIPVMGITRQETIDEIIEETKPRILVTESKYSSKVDRFSATLDIYFTNVSDPSARPLSQLMAMDCMPEPLGCPAEQTLLILYTTGSTGMPKGVMHSAKALLFLTTKEFSLYHQFFPVDRALICLSLSHIFNLIVAFSMLFAGGTLYLEPNDSSATALLKSIVENKLTVMAAVPSMYRLLIDYVADKPPVEILRQEPDAPFQHATSRDWQKPLTPQRERGAFCSGINHHLRLCIVSGDIVPKPLHVDFKAAFGLMLNEGIGSTETMVTATNPMDDAQKRLGSAGKPFTNVQIKIDRPDGEGRGEILVKSPYLLQRYYNEEQSRENEWFHTGDIGFMDDDGYLWFQGRMKDIIIHDGYNISPLEIEAVLHEYPAVKEAAAIGVPSELYGEDLVVYISFLPGTNHRDEKAIGEFLALRLEYFKHPRKIVILDALPKNRMGKADRIVLKEEELARAGC